MLRVPIQSSGDTSPSFLFSHRLRDPRGCHLCAQYLHFTPGFVLGALKSILNVHMPFFQRLPRAVLRLPMQADRRGDMVQGVRLGKSLCLEHMPVYLVLVDIVLVVRGRIRRLRILVLRVKA